MDGFFGGWSQAGADQRADVASKLSQQEGQQRLLIGDQVIQENDIKIAQAKTAAQMQQRFLQNVQARGQDNKPSAAESIANIADAQFKLSQDAANAGLFKESETYARTGADLLHNQSEIDKVSAKTRQDDFATLGNVMNPATIKNQADFDKALQTASMLRGHEIPPQFKNAKYSPELVTYIHNFSMDQTKTAEVKLKEAEAAKNWSEYSMDQARIPLIAAQTKEAEARAKNLEKNGSGNLIPKTSDLRMITDKVISDFGRDDVDPARARSLAGPVAEQALQYINGGMPRDEAFQKAYSNARKNGTFAGIKNTVAPGSTATKPRPLPKTEDKLEDNMYYLMKDGTSRSWDAKSKMFITPQQTTESTEESDDE